jgi:hypothetical protein
MQINISKNFNTVDKIVIFFNPVIFILKIYNKTGKIRWRKLISLFVDASKMGISKTKLLIDFLRSGFILKLILRDVIMRTKNLIPNLLK